VYCGHCGAVLTDGAKYCAVCGAKTGAQTPAGQPGESASRPNARRKQKCKAVDWLLLCVAAVLIFLGVGHLALAVAGSSVTAQVTGCERVLYLNNDDSTRNASRYKLEYQFSVDGQTYTGSVTRVFTGGSQLRQTLPVRYLPVWPHINAEDTDISPVGPVMLGTGVLLLVFGAGKRLGGRKKERPVERRE